MTSGVLRPGARINRFIHLAVLSMLGPSFMALLRKAMKQHFVGHHQRFFSVPERPPWLIPKFLGIAPSCLLTPNNQE